MCSRLGIRHAYSQAYHPRANGRAERAGQSIIELLKKMHTDNNINWVEALPRILFQYHDVVNETGHSPYKIMFGRDRMGLGIPYPPEKSCEDAENFFDRIAILDEQISAHMSTLHMKNAITFNEDKTTRPYFSPGDQVWLLKPKSLSSQSKLEPRWTGPMTVQQRLGNSCYSLIDLYRDTHAAHLDQIKIFKDNLVGERTLLEFQGPTHFPVRKSSQTGTIIDHRCLTPKNPEFLVNWNNEDISEGVWEKPSTFLRMGQLKALWDYCLENHISLEVSDLFMEDTMPSSQ